VLIDPGVLIERLTPRQRECLRLVFERQTSKEIAVVTGLAIGTIDTYIAEAIATLGARNRRHAAEILHLAETQGDNTAPSKVEFDPTGVPNPAAPAPPGRHGSPSPHWRWLLPIRPTGAADNDLAVLIRLAWIPAIAILLAIGFGAVVGGLGVLSDILGRKHG